MRSLKKSGKYDLQKLKKDALGSLTAVGWIFPLALAFGSNSPFGAAAGLVGAIAACIIGSATNGLAGIALFLILFFAFAMAVVALQGSISEKALFRKMAMSRCPQYIKVKPQRLIGSWKSTEE